MLRPPPIEPSFEPGSGWLSFVVRLSIFSVCFSLRFHWGNSSSKERGSPSCATCRQGLVCVPSTPSRKPLMPRTRHIYALYTTGPQTLDRAYFYVGRSFDPEARARQHRRAVATGTEDKYVYMRQLAAVGRAWSWEELGVVQPDDHEHDSERWWVIRLIREGHMLRNMRHGSRKEQLELAAQVSDPSIRSAEDVRRQREQREARQADATLSRSRQFVRRQRRVDAEAALKSGIRNVATCSALPRGLRHRLVRDGVVRIEAGVSLRSVYSLTCARARLDELVALCVVGT